MAAQTFIKDGDNSSKWLQPFDAQLVEITLDKNSQPGVDYGNLDAALKAMKPTVYHQKKGKVQGYQFSIDILGVDGKVLPVSRFTRRIAWSRACTALHAREPYHE